MIFLIAFVVVLAGMLFDASRAKWKRIKQQAIQERDAVFLDCDMSAKLRELVDGPQTMSETEWRQWLPIFEDADQEVRSKTNLPLGRHAEMIRRFILKE